MGQQGAQPRLVGTNRRVRTAAFAYTFLTIAAHLWPQGAPAGTWVFLALQFLVYPQLVYWRATRSAHPNRAERDNLYLDAALLGAWAAFLGFPTWITFAIVGATLLNAAINRGAHGIAVSLGCSLAGAALWAAVGGLRHLPATSDLVTAMAFVGALAYGTAVGYVVYRQTRRLKRARADLVESEARYRMLAENAADLIAMVDERGRWLYTSPSLERLLEPASLALGADAFAKLHPDDADGARNAVARAAATGRARELTVRLVDREGRLRHLKTRFKFVPESGRVVMVAHDVTDLRDSEERLLLAAHALEGMTEAILITSADGTVVTVNRAFTAISGYTRDDVLGQHESAVRNALQPPEYYDEVFRTVHASGYWSGTTWSRRKNGSVYREWRSVRAVRDGAGKVTHYVSVFCEVGGGTASGGSGMLVGA